MNVASLELCKELYELSDRTWHEEIIYSWHKDDGDYVIEDFWTGSICPAYDLGYLLRKLQIKPERQKDYLTFQYFYNSNKWGIGFANHNFEDADTPEDAAAKLAIELFKQNILKPEQHD